MEISLTEELLEKIDKYITGKLIDSELNIFEKQLKESKQLQEEVTLQKQLINIIGQEKWHTIGDDKKNEELQKLKEKIRSEEYQLLSKKIRNIGNLHVEKKSSFNLKYLYYAGAAMVVLMASIFTFNTNQPLDSYYTNYANWEELPSFVEKGTAKNDFIVGETYFKKENYTKAIESFNLLNTKSKYYPYSLMYLGAAYELINKDEAALQAFDKLINLKSFDENTKGYWYKMLIYLKLNNKEKVLEMISMISEDKGNYKYEASQKLLKQIND